MPAVNASTLLQAWEEALDRPGPERALRLAAVCPEAATGDPARWSVRRRDAALFDLRLLVFGRFAQGVAPCAACGATLEMRLDLAELRPAPQPDDEALRVVRRGDVVFTYRLPNCEDLVAAGEADDDGDARTRLLRRCVSSVTEGGAEVPVDSRGGDFVEPVASALAGDHADLASALELECPVCLQRTEVPFAIDAFLWREVDAWARRTLQEVHALACEYGWTEDEILRLSATRRRHYLELAVPDR